MTRSQALAIITARLATVDDATLEAAATQLARDGEALTIGDIIEVFGADSTLPRELTQRELKLIAQSNEDFRLGRTHSLDESEAIVDAELARRRRLREVS